MNNITLLGIDIAKEVFQLHGVNEMGQTSFTKRLSRKTFSEFMIQLPPCTVVMECCGTSHHWGRVFKEYGHDVKLISPQFVKPYVMGNKNDRNDAAAIVEAAKAVNARFVPIKTVEQQDMQALLRIRQSYIRERTRLSNQMRGFALENGVFIPKSFTALKKQLPGYLEDESVEFSSAMKAEIKALFELFKETHERIKDYDKKIGKMAANHTMAQKLMTILGVGPKSAIAILAMGDLSHIQNGRGFGAYLGLVPRQHSSGNNARLQGISKRGNTYVRELLIHGARAVIARVKDKSDPKSLWLKALIARRGTNRAAVALANKHARVIWHLMVHGEEYKPELLTSWKEAA